jgi:uncharacterized iron-regulated membrane protein
MLVAAERVSGVTPARGGLYAMLWRWHFLAALIVIPFVLWQATTGALYLWAEWWMDVHHSQLRFVEPAAASFPPSEQIGAAFAAVRISPPALTSSPHSHGTTPTAEITKTVPTDGASQNLTRVQEIIISDDPHRATIVVLQDSVGLAVPVFVDPHSLRILGSLTALEWLPGITRALHGGWPLGKPGSWLLELGDGWAIFMIVTGFYLWWPRGRTLREALLPRFRAGPRILLRDLHACVAVLFSTVFLFFLISALPWTAFWGQELLPRLESALGQVSPAGFSPGGASVSQLNEALSSIDEITMEARSRAVPGTLEIRLAPWTDAPLFVTNRDNAPSEDRTLLGEAATGKLIGDFHNADLPVIPRLVALGVHLHQGDFGQANVWLNTAFAFSLVWLSVTGVVSWWIRRPKRKSGIPPKVRASWPRALIAVVVIMCALMPIFAASMLAAATTDRLMCRWFGRF